MEEIKNTYHLTDATLFSDYNAMLASSGIDMVIVCTCLLYTSTLKQKSPESFAVETHQDGHIYALPRVSQYRPDYLESPIWINKEWLEAVDMDVPTLSLIHI